MFTSASGRWSGLMVPSGLGMPWSKSIMSCWIMPSHFGSGYSPDPAGSSFPWSAWRSFDHHRFRRTQIDAVGARGHVILARPRLAKVGEHGLAGFLELVDIEAQLFQLRPSRREAFGLQHDRLDAPIRRGFFQRAPDPDDGQRRVVIAHK